MKNRFDLLYQPESTWSRIKNRQFSVADIYLKFLIIMAAIPPICGYIGSVYIGWSVGSEEPTKLTPQSALSIAITAYLAILVAAYVFARFIHWMAKTYESEARFKDCLALVVYSCVPLFFASIVSVYPVLWLDTLITIAAVGFSARLLFLGTPIMMGINQERAFLFTNSILTVGMVLTVAGIAITVLFWSSAMVPEFTN